MVYIAFDPIYKHDLPAGHRFPMEKYELIPAQLLYEGLVSQDNFFSPSRLGEEDILSVHSDLYWENLQNLNISASDIRKIGFPLSQSLIEREVCIAQGTLEGSLKALEHGIAFNVAGGTHHAFHDRGEGFCILNDQAIAAGHLIRTGKANRILIVDLDVHQGNGTASIFREEDRVFTFSMHGKNNYPFHKEISNRDIGLLDRISDQDYLDLLNHHLEDILDHFQPDFLFYQAGVDILETDALGKLNISARGCQLRDKKVISEAFQRKIPLMVCMGGGYSPKIQDIVSAHCNTFRTGLDYFG